MTALLNVEVTSKDMMKPSNPTPHHLRSFKLSFLDQIAAPNHVPTILFYENPSPLLSNTTTLLKSSLSKTLVRFYPVAGRIIFRGDNKPPSLIDCNDEGVEFNEARVSTNLSAVVQDPDLDELNKLLPFPAIGSYDHTLIGVQVNHFSCGGVALGFCVSHYVMDAFTVVTFLDAWSAIARGAPFDRDAKTMSSSADLFPPRDLPNNGFPIRPGSSTLHEEKLVTTRLIFNKEKINDLKRKVVVEGSITKAPSRSLLVSAYIWKRFIEAARTKPHPPKIFGARQSVNFRAIPNSPPIDRLGNIYANSPVASYYLVQQQQQQQQESTNTTSSSTVGRDGDLVQLIDKLEVAQRQVDVNFLKRVQNGENPRALPREYTDENVSAGDVEICGFSSVVWFPFYKVNFGWGEPVWVSLTSLPFKNMVILYPTKSGEDIEVWLFISQDYVSVIEQESRLPQRAFTKPILPRL